MEVESGYAQPPYTKRPAAHRPAGPAADDRGTALVRRVDLSGEYDLSRRHDLGSLFEALPEGAPVVVDLTNVTYVDSSFLHALTALHYRFKEWGVTLVGARPQIRRILQIMNVEQLFTMAESM